MFMLPTFRLNIERWKYNPYFELWISNMGHIRSRDKKHCAQSNKEWIYSS